jgi:hypothetical protein
MEGNRKSGMKKEEMKEEREVGRKKGGGQTLLPQLLTITVHSQIQEAGRCGCTALEMALLIDR